ncbi:outer membrane protein assembly factor BamB family protein [Aeoliella mucimassa]|uniref:Outer membrane biogenesis protein BamB n=1 Tax=Aeoliella mucimassa TaxID=2527972 RepID=A0A518APG1_9BACT|nr:PQQ-binding-like beta-propeller repeat protein [Aeoliella mucimassa]QDU56606.1 outer membrane biogenesis protein BamB [Aeoliella mucimassa]
MRRVRCQLLWGITLFTGVLLGCSPQEMPSGQEVSEPVPTISRDQVLQNWPNFRGPDGLGRAPTATPPIDWDVAEGKGVKWSIELPKHGMSSPVVWEQKVFLTGADDDTRQVYCLNADTGALLWQHDVELLGSDDPTEELPNVLQETGFAAPTPATNGHYVAAIFATGELVCCDFDGTRKWAKSLGVPDNHYGHASSLLCYGELLFVQFDQWEHSKLLAINLASGEIAWEVDRNEISWTSPILIEHQGRRELVLTNCKSVDGYAPEDGKHLWHLECLDAEVAASPAYGGGVLFVGNDMTDGSAIELPATDSTPRILWQYSDALPDATSPVANDEWLLIPTAFGVVSCLDLKTGEVVWEHEFNQGFTSSPILVGDRVFLFDLAGVLRVLNMGRDFEELATIDLGQRVYATPAYVGKRIYIRSLSQVICVEPVSN